MTRASAKLDRSRVNSEGGHYVASFFVPLPTIGMNSYDLLNLFLEGNTLWPYTNTVFQS